MCFIYQSRECTGSSTSLPNLKVGSATVVSVPSQLFTAHSSVSSASVWYLKMRFFQQGTENIFQSSCAMECMRGERLVAKG